MKTEPRLPQMAAPQTEAPRPAVDTVIERLAFTGYHIDREKWERFATYGLLPSAVIGSVAERETIGRARRILEVETKLAPTGNLDALCYFLAAAGIDGVPAGPVARYVAASLTSLFAVGDRVRAGIRWESRFVGPDGEWRLSRLMARSLLRTNAAASRAESAAMESLLSAAFVAYARSTYANPRPARRLHESSTLVNLEAEEEEGIGAKVRAGDPPLAPLADRTGLIAWVGEQSGGDVLLRAVRGSAALIRLNSPSFPEISAAWRECATRCGSDGAQALAALMLVPPVLAAAYIQAGQSPLSPQLESALDRLMHFWGTVSTDLVRFELSTRSFPWVARDGGQRIPGQTGQ